MQIADQLLEKRAQSNPRSLFLEVGCGEGEYVTRHTERGLRMMGLDMRPRFPKRSEFILADTCSLPFHSASFDAIVAFGVLEHIPDYNSALEEIYRVIKPGGVFFLTIPNRWRPREGHVPLWFPHWLPGGWPRKLWLRLWGKGARWDRYISELNMWAPWEAKAVLSDHFDTVEYRTRERLRAHGSPLWKRLAGTVGAHFFFFMEFACYKAPPTAD